MPTTTTQLGSKADIEAKRSRDIVRLRDSIDNALRAGANQENFNLQGLVGDVRQALLSVYQKNISFRIAKSMIRASQKRLGIPTSWDDEWNFSTVPAVPRGLGRKRIEAKVGRLINGIYREANRGRIKAEKENRALRKRIEELEKKIAAIRSASS